MGVTAPASAEWHSTPSGASSTSSRRKQLRPPFARTASCRLGGAGSGDVHVVNTCTVTSRADHKARSLIRGLARDNPHAPLLVTGCSAQTEAEALSALASNVVVIPQSEKSRILRSPRRWRSPWLQAMRASPERPWRPPGHVFLRLSGTVRPETRSRLTVTDFSFHTRAFLKIQDGCDCSCAYCRVPRARGGSVSLGLEEALARAAEWRPQVSGRSS